MSRRRGETLNGPAPITFESIASWSTLFRWPLKVWECSALVELDDAFLATLAEKEGEPK